MSAEQTTTSEAPPSCLNYSFSFRAGQLATGRIPLVMGILNVTPDSFSDGGVHLDLSRLRDTALAMAAEGAAILDIGGESSRPGAPPVAAAEELRRVLPAIEAIRAESAVPLSIDTVKPEVAREAIAAGANIINDICGFANPKMRQVAADTGAGAIIMHMQGLPQSMQVNPTYTDVVAEVRSFLGLQIERLVQDGIARERTMIDPGLGFGKTKDHNLKLLQEIDAFASLKRPVLVGISRKSTIGALTGRKTEERLAGTLAAQAFTMSQTGNLVFRVHDVPATIDLCKVWSALAR